MRTEITKVYEKGDVVWVLMWDKESYLPELCPVCEGCKTILANNKTKPCPQCQGKGELMLSSYKFVAHVYKSTITKVDNYEAPPRYALNSGYTVWTDSVYDTEEEALTEAARQMKWWRKTKES
jgi:RNA polymerase subunit RPABC4/transcription elongation factor Spt4